MTDPTKAPAAGVDGLRTALVNAKYALEYWTRETKHGGKMPAWADGPMDRTWIELRRIDAALTATGALPRQDDGVLREARDPYDMIAEALWRIHVRDALKSNWAWGFDVSRHYFDHYTRLAHKVARAALSASEGEK
jgi:hypothetical protein